MGPSASQVSVDADGQMQEALRALGVLLANPYGLQTLVANLTGGAACTEFAKARRGEPASSKPTGVPATMMPEPVNLKPEDLKPAPEAEAVIVANANGASPAPTAVDPPSGEKHEGGDSDVINSSTHRAAHARLARRMASMEATECPHMQRLWQGSRKDWVGANLKTHKRKWGEYP